MSDNALLDALATIGNFVDTPRAVAWQAAKGGSVLDVVNPFDEESVAKRPTGWDLREWLADTTGQEWLRNKEGFDWLDVPTALSEVVLDPLNAFAGLKAFKTAATAKELRPVAQAARESNLLREAGLAKGFMPEEVYRQSAIPQRVYHGTDADFDRFAKSADVGYHFGTPDQAESRLAALAKGPEDFDEGARVRMAFLDARRPLPVDDFAFETPERLYSTLKKGLPATPALPDVDAAMREYLQTRYPNAPVVQPGKPIPLDVAEFFPETGAEKALLASKKTGAYRSLRDWLESGGYDSLVYRNEVEGPGLSMAVLRPEQIYAPYIAPALRDIPNLPSNKRLAALLALMNAERQGKNLTPTLPIEEVL